MLTAASFLVRAALLSPIPTTFVYHQHLPRRQRWPLVLLFQRAAECFRLNSESLVRLSVHSTMAVNRGLKAAGKFRPWASSGGGRVCRDSETSRRLARPPLVRDRMAGV